jgi:hypothetical protein
VRKIVIAADAQGIRLRQPATISRDDVCVSYRVRGLNFERTGQSLFSNNSDTRLEVGAAVLLPSGPFVVLGPSRGPLRPVQAWLARLRRVSLGQQVWLASLEPTAAKASRQSVGLQPREALAGPVRRVGLLSAQMLCCRASTLRKGRKSSWRTPMPSALV